MERQCRHNCLYSGVERRGDDMLRVLIVDDEPLMCDELRCVLEQIGGVEIIGVCQNGEDVPGVVLREKPDIMFLDIQMPGISGMQVARIVASQPYPPAIVFVTAYDKFALEAFGVSAVDYILKPFDNQDIQRSLERIRRRLPSNERTPGPVTMKKMLVEAGDRLEVIDYLQIQLFRAEERQVFLHTTDGRIYEVKYRLSELEEILDSQKFFRCHRNYIVNVDQIKQVANWFNRGYILILQSPSIEIPVGRVYISKLRQHLPL